ncbi:MAG: TonB-dependent receptor [Bacteroidetes bacterium]|nr:MAG: TonB-dependent receptor [Bacteroidota bacterium]
MKKIVTILSFFIFTGFAFAQKGKLAGKVTDKATGEDIIGATILIEGTTIGATTDLDGKYFLQVAPGTYNVVVSYVSYKTKKYEGVVIKEGELTSINVSLDENSIEIEEVVIQGEIRKETAAGLLIQQKNAVSMSSGISAELIKRTPDRTTADVIKRVSGATIQDGKFAIIRGMQDRYNYGMINGVPLPSSEPDRKAFSLDLVPSSVVDNLVIYKTATPDKPGEFAGGLIEITTKEVPDENTAFVNVGLGGNSITTFQRFEKSPQAGGLDFLGFDNGARQLPDLSVSLAEAEANRGNPMPIIDKVVEDTRKFNNNFRPIRTNALPNFSLQGGLSQRLKLFNNNLGIIGVVTYNNSNLYNPFEQNTVRAVDTKSGSKYIRTDSTSGNFYNIDNFRNMVNVGGLLNFTYKVGLRNKFFLKNLLTQSGTDNTVFRTGQLQNGSGFGENVNYALYNDIGYFYQSSRILFTQLGGEHILSETKKIKLNYVLGYNNFFNQTPDAKKTFSRQEGNTLAEAATAPSVFNGFDAPGSQNTPGRFFSNLNEQTYSASADLSVPVLSLRSSFKFGGMVQSRSRKFAGRYFNFSRFDKSNLSNNIFDSISNNNISATNFFQVEATQPSDSYSASSGLIAGYAMAETKIVPSLRAIYGLRVERFNQKLNSARGTIASPKEVPIDTTWLDFLPSANLIYAVNENINLRASYSKTLSRPEFREFAPLAFFDMTRNSIFVGNEKLTRARVDNFDAKFEIYPKPGYTFSINPFLKTFEKPIVYVLQPASGYAQISLANAKNAIVAGVELEGRVGFTETKIPVIKNFTCFGNLALIYSKVDQSNFKTDVAGVDSTIFKTQLQGQSPYVLNLGVTYATEKEWNFTLAMNTYGRRIALVGTNEAFIVYESPRVVLDASITKTFAKKFNAKVTIGDLFAQDLILYYDLNKSGSFDDKNGDEVFERYRRGYTVSFSVGYTF